MYLYSTNRRLPGGFQESVDFRKALFMGQAPDGGLFMPWYIPKMSPGTLFSLTRLSFPEVAAVVIHAFLEQTMSFEDCLEICRDSFDFDVPLYRAPDDVFIMRLDRGPTASFKDFAARFLARVMRKLGGGRKFTVLVATSGDTGSAVGEAFRELSDVPVVILYPKGEVSAFQKRQLDTIGGGVRAIEVEGKFDDCQALVKKAFADADLAKLGLTSANSINIGRILPQMTYYFWAWARSSGVGKETVFAVPSGNFGNAFAGDLARRMGLPVSRILLATNENDEFPRFMKSEDYQPLRPSRACLSNSMNVGHPSNLARFFDAYSGTVDKNGKVWQQPDIAEMRERLWSTSVSDGGTRLAIKHAHARAGYMLDPHGAVAWAALEMFRAATGDRSPSVILETADPYKFPESVREALGFDPPMPPTMLDVSNRTGSATPLANDYDQLKSFLLSLP